MPYAKFINSSEFPYHVTNRCINRDWFALPIEKVWEIVSEQLCFTSHAFSLRIHAFVLMSNHYHMLVTTPEANLSGALNHFQSETARRIVKDAHRINHMWARRFKRCLITNDHYFNNAYKYLYRNPVEVFMCDRPENYKFSSLPGLLGFRRLEFPVFDPLFPEDAERVLTWINIEPEEKMKKDMRKALRRSCFGLPRLSGKSHPLETQLL